MMQKIDGISNDQLLLFKNDVLISFRKSKYNLKLKTFNENVLQVGLTPMTRPHKIKIDTLKVVMSSDTDILF